MPLSPFVTGCCRDTQRKGKPRRLSAHHCRCNVLTLTAWEVVNLPFPAVSASNRTQPRKLVENIPVYYRHKADGFRQNGNGFYKHLSLHRPLDRSPHLKENKRCGMYFVGVTRTFLRTRQNHFHLCECVNFSRAINLHVNSRCFFF